MELTPDETGTARIAASAPASVSRSAEAAPTELVAPCPASSSARAADAASRAVPRQAPSTPTRYAQRAIGHGEAGRLDVVCLTLPPQLDAASVDRLTRDLAAVCAAPAPVIAMIGAAADTFCTGMAIGAAIEDAAATHAFARLLALLHEAPKPLLAIVDGRAIGGGLGLACACDLVVSTTRATFALPELVWGLVPAIIWPIVTDRMAPHVARQWTMTAHTRSAAEAHACGVVDEVVAPDRLDAAAVRAVRALRRLEPDAVRRLRQWSRDSRTLSMPDALEAGAAITASMMQRPDVQRRWRAFVDGEAPWSV